MWIWILDQSYFTVGGVTQHNSSDNGKNKNSNLFWARLSEAEGEKTHSPQKIMRFCCKFLDYEKVLQIVKAE